MRTRRGLVAVMAVTALTLTACGGGDADEPADTSDDGTTEESPAEGGDDGEGAAQGKERKSDT